MKSRLAGLIIAVIVVAASIGGTAYWLSIRSSSSTPGRWADGPTLYQAIDQVNTTVRNTTGGPWELFSYIGFAPEGPFSPAAYGYVNSTNLTLKYCQSQFNGLTVWNGTSFPVFNGSIASGTATFWQFAFFSSASHEIVVATDILGVTRVYLPVPLNNPCMSVTGMASGAIYYESWVNPLPVDTSVQAAAGYDVVGKAFAAIHTPLVETYANGWTPLSDATNHGPGGGVEYTLCGLVGASGYQPKSVVGELANGTVQSTFNGSLSCTAVAEAGPPVVYASYIVAMRPPGTPTPVGGGSAGLSFAIQTEFQSSPTNTTPVFFDAWGLMSWMTKLSVRNATDQNLAVTPLSCQNWVPSLADCHPAGVGWSVVLVSPSGDWMDTFPSIDNASAWAIPNVPLIGGEQLVVTYPAAWNVSSDEFVVVGTASVPTVSGSALL
jgi:hypothetical protein